MVLDGGHLWVADMVDNQVVEVDPRSLRAGTQRTVPTGPSSLAALGGRVWVTSAIAGEITPIDMGSGAVGMPVDVPDGAVRLAAGFGALWVSGTSDRSTYWSPRRRGSACRIWAASRSAAVRSGSRAGAGSVWVANARGGTVSEVDPHSLRVVRTLRVGGDPRSLAVAGGHLYVGTGGRRRWVRRSRRPHCSAGHRH